MITLKPAVFSTPSVHRRSTRNRRRLGPLSLLVIAATTLDVARASADAHRRDDLSFRGPVPEDLRIPHWDLSGTALVRSFPYAFATQTSQIVGLVSLPHGFGFSKYAISHRIPSAKDFVRLLHPFPLAYGAMYTDQPIPFDQWSVEVAFRIHGAFSDVHHGHRNESTPANEDQYSGKGGRGIAFWYSKNPNPTPIVASANPKHHTVQPPSLNVDPFPDPLDEAVSFFGGPTSFNGLAVVIDNQPSTPLTRRSDRKHWGVDEGGIGAEEWAVISGVMDDGKGHQKFLEDHLRSDLDEDEEAAYLNHTIGDCQVAMRNAAGLVWIKVTYVGSQLSVSLDLSPHSTLSGTDRHYKRECFSASNIKLPKGYYMGLTGLASPSDEVDNVDVYAIEVKEIKGKAKSEEEVLEHYKEEHVAADDVKLEGTAKTKDLAFEAINAQKTWANTMKQMSQRLDALNRAPSAGDSTQTSQTVLSGSIDHQIGTINTKLEAILQKLDKLAAPGFGGTGKTELLQKIFDLEEQSNRHEMFLSEQIEELRHLILNPPPSTFKEDAHFKPLEHQHDSAPASGPPSSSFSDHFQHDRNAHETGQKMTMLKFLSWTFGTIVVLFGILKITQFIVKKSRKSNDFGSDEGSFFVNSGSVGNHSNSGFSMAMDSFGFRQRSKKMI